jgi:hypothetical protein
VNICSSWHSNLHKHHFLPPFRILFQKHLKGEQLLRNPFDHVKPINAQHHLIQDNTDNMRKGGKTNPLFHHLREPTGAYIVIQYRREKHTVYQNKDFLIQNIVLMVHNVTDKIIQTPEAELRIPYSISTKRTPSQLKNENLIGTLTTKFSTESKYG